MEKNPFYRVNSIWGRVCAIVILIAFIFLNVDTSVKPIDIGKIGSIQASNQHLLKLTVDTGRVSCKGVSKKTGLPCRSTFVKKATGYCRMHDPNTPNCQKKGCGNKVKTEGEYCRSHKE